MIIIYTISGVVGFAASTFAVFLPTIFGGGGITVGASAPIFGLLASLVYYGRRTGSSMVGDQAKVWAVGIFIFGFIMPGVDNWAHIGGFVGGYLTSRVLDPLHPERLDHLIAALVCLGATGIAFVVSLLDGLGRRL
jgi:rhomboid protease GluP